MNNKIVEILNNTIGAETKHDWSTGFYPVPTGIEQAAQAIVDQLGLDWVSVSKRLPEDDSNQSYYYDTVKESFWCEFAFDENDKKSYFGECQYYFDIKEWTNTDGSKVIVKRWRPLLAPPEVNE